MECEECGGRIIKDDLGEPVCERCGLVYKDLNMNNQDSPLDNISIYNSKDLDHHGDARDSQLNNYDLHTTISEEKHNNYRAYRLRWMQRKIRYEDTNKRTLIDAQTQINRLGSNFDLPSHTQKRALYLFQKLKEKKWNWTKDTKWIISALIHYVSKENGKPIPVSDISEFTEVSEKHIWDYFKEIKKELNLEHSISGPTDYLESLCSDIDMQFEYQKETEELIGRIEKETGMVERGYSPVSICASSIYITIKKNDLDIQQKELAENCSVTVQTIRNRYPQIIEKLDLDVEVNRRKQ